MGAYASNRYCVEKLLALSESQAVVAAHDIYDEHGLKLLAKGAAVSRELQDRLLLRKLRAPLESSLTVREGVTFTELLQGALGLIDQLPVLQRVAGSQQARAILRDGQHLHIPPPLSLLLSCTAQSDPMSYRRTQVVAVFCAGIAAQLDASTNDTHLAMIAAAFHDIGETYVNPEYVHPSRVLTPQEWRHVAAHPQVGQLLIRDLTNLPASVAACVGQHHERHDGSGYPAQLLKHDLQPVAGWIAVADASAALVERPDDAADRISLALRIVPEEFCRRATDAVIHALQGIDHGTRQPLSPDCVTDAQALVERITAAVDALEAVLAASAGEAAKRVCERTLDLLHAFAKALRATGILDTSGLTREDINDHQLLYEMQCIVGEVSWRLRNLARNLYLHISAWRGDPTQERVDRTIALLDGSAAANVAR